MYQEAMSIFNLDIASSFGDCPAVSLLELGVAKIKLRVLKNKACVS